MSALAYILRYYNISPTYHLPRVLTGVWRRKELAGLFKRLDYKIGVEVGVWSGAFTRLLCHENQQAKIIGVDAWQTYDGYTDIEDQKELDWLYQEAVERLKPYNCELRREYSMDAVKRFDDGELDFVYIDGNHDYDYVMADITEWSKKVRRDGIVSGHDYDLPGVRDAVTKFTVQNDLVPWFVLDATSSPSWFYVKE